jgi:glutamine amidotransferase
MKIGVIDYGMGNIGSICNMLKYIGTDFVVSREECEISRCDKIILPGVGNFDLAMINISKFNLDKILEDLVFSKKIPLLGICLGMQLLCEDSEEGNRKGLGFVSAKVKKFKPSPESDLKVPHMGWSNVSLADHNTLSHGLTDQARFYFVHSYFVECHNQGDIWGRSEYGHPFISAFIRDNIVGVQFHPEKSHKFGVQLFRNFVDSFYT